MGKVADKPAKKKNTYIRETVLRNSEAFPEKNTLLEFQYSLFSSILIKFFFFILNGYIISSYGIIECPVTYWECSNPACRKHHHDTIIGVTGSANYSDEYLQKQKIVRMVSDEDNAIIDSVRYVFPDILHSFCVFHKLKNITNKYLEEFEEIENIHPYKIKIYELAKDLILSENAIDSTVCMRNIETLVQT